MAGNDFPSVLMAQLIAPHSPRLPTFSTEYDPQMANQFADVLRLYFNNIDGAFQQLLLGFNNFGKFYNATTLTNPVINTANLVTFDTPLASFGVAVGAITSRLEIKRGGIYAVHHSIQADTSGGAAITIDFWIRKNGTDIAGTSSKVTVGNAADERVYSRSTLIGVSPGDYIEITWASASLSAQLSAFAAAAPYPLVPSVTVSIQYVCPDGLGG
jgi:hypothetical protein